MKFVAHYEMVFANHESQRKERIIFETVLNDLMVPGEGTVMPFPDLDKSGNILWRFKPFSEIKSSVVSVGRYLADSHWLDAKNNACVLHPIVYVEVVYVPLFGQDDMICLVGAFVQALREMVHVVDLHTKTS